MDKRRERILLDRFLGTDPSFQGCEVIQDDAPDFVVVRQGDRIGIEVTEYNRSGPKDPRERGREKEQDAIVQVAHQSFEFTSTDTLRVKVLWIDNDVLRLRNRSIVARELADFVRANVPPFGQVVVIPYPVLEGPSLLSQALASVAIRRLPDGRKPHWACLRAGYLATDLAGLVAAIDDKESKVAQYRARVPGLQVWLVVACNRHTPSSGLDTDIVTDGRTFRSSFDRVYLLDVFVGRAIRLPIKPPSVHDA